MPQIRSRGCHQLRWHSARRVAHWRSSRSLRIRLEFARRTLQFWKHLWHPWDKGLFSRVRHARRSVAVSICDGCGIYPLGQTDAFRGPESGGRGVGRIGAGADARELAVSRAPVSNHAGYVAGDRCALRSLLPCAHIDPAFRIRSPPSFGFHGLSSYPSTRACACCIGGKSLRTPPRGIG